MIRTLISISKEDKEWIEQFSRHSGQSLAQTVRTAIRLFREAVKKHPKRGVLKETGGLWSRKKEDGLDYVSRLRGEWDSLR